MLNQDIDNHDIHLFCIANLLKRKDATSIAQFLNTNLRNKTKEQWVDIIKLIKSEWEEFNILLRQAFFRSQIEWIICSETDLWIDQSMFGGLHEEMGKAKKTLTRSSESINSIFNNSLDKLINKKNISDEEILRQLIPRETFYYKKKKEEEISDLEEWFIEESSKYDKIPIDVNWVLKGGHEMYVLLGNVWEWKSTFLASIAKEIQDNNDFLPLFYSSKDHSSITDARELIWIIEADIKIIETTIPTKKIIIIFDGIDELNIEIRIAIVAYLSKKDSGHSNISWTKVILWSRKSWFEEYGTHEYQTIWFKWLNNATRNEFLKSRLLNLWVEEGKLKEKINEIDNALNWLNLDEELKNTPLVLFLFCKLASEENLSDICNRAQLYEKICYSILSDHQGEKAWLKIWFDDRDFPGIMNTLSFCAYRKFTNKSISEDEIRNFLKEEYSHVSNQKKQTTLIDSLINQIFLLYKINNGEYAFILKSFEEYFLARHLASIQNWNEEIFKVRDEKAWETKWDEWRNFKPVVLFYWEILANSWKEEDLKKLEELLGEKWLLDSDDIFGEGFFMGLEILFNISNWAKDGNIHRLIDEYLTIIDY
ncbi:MAG: hypothetical protein ACD_4C00071G0001, partial [uncultured bacterium (gcode 4)]